MESESDSTWECNSSEFLEFLEPVTPFPAIHRLQAKLGWRKRKQKTEFGSVG